jgi:hypothetical protein
MKKKSFSKKLLLNKSTVTNLTNNQKKQVLGGASGDECHLKEETDVAWSCTCGGGGNTFAETSLANGCEASQTPFGCFDTNEGC